MATEYETSERQSEERVKRRPAWIGGVIGGLAGGAVMGLMLSMMMTPVIQQAIPALWGLEGMGAGWVIHLINSVIFGVIFAMLVTRTGLRRYERSVGRSTVLGLVYGTVIWIVAAGFVMPIWLQAVGFPMVPPLPNFDPMSLVGHLVFGGILGIVYPYVSGFSE
ncbi:histidine kinase [Haladaptatus halobius]|uniref:histidine kinase n=1 Tax=Haladaptatus halobius TaxID=2884875 RepID=UPI001D0B301B|nr:histidine kinase [Haladaptatus halobius]